MYFAIRFLLSVNLIVLLFHNSNSNHLIYSGVQILLVLDGCSGVLLIL